MALSHEDKKDVKNALGKPMANRINKVTQDYKTKALDSAKEKPEKLSKFAKSIGLEKGRYFCSRCEGQSHNVDFEGKCKSCSN